MHLSRLHRMIVGSLMLTTLVVMPVRAEEGELTANDAKTSINVRDAATTKAEIVGSGAVGDRVTVLQHSTGNDGLIWYQVKLKSGKTGWVRGDLVRVFGPKIAKLPPPQPKTQPVKPESAKPQPIESQPPQQPAPAANATPSPPVAAPPAVEATAAENTANLDRLQPLPEPMIAEQPTPQVPEVNAAPPSTPDVAVPNAIETVGASTALTTSATLVSFQTSTYAVRIFSEAGQLRLNLYNKKTNALALKSVPVKSESTSDGTIYSYGTDVEVKVRVPASGPFSLTTQALGTTLDETAE